jgi:RNA polymerase sigma factor (sigma-70 family)
LIGDRDAARDLVHDAFVDVYRRWDTMVDPGPYLNVAVLNRCRDHGRRATRRRSRNELLVVRDQAPDEPLWDALQQLPFHHRAALVMHFHLRMTNDEIADALGCRPGSVGPWIQRGLARLRKDLQ